MSLSAKTIMPTASFMHISVMVGLMSVLLGIAGFGYISVSHLTNLWLSDITDTLSIEIPAYDNETTSILSPEDIEDHYKNVMHVIDGDPIITNIKVNRPDEDTVELDIPSPIFLTLSLHPDRADNAEGRLIDSIHDISDTIIVRSEDDWETDIQSMTLILKTAFSMLGLSVFIVTIVVMSGVIRTQLKASKDTLALVHLMGASANNISHIFQKSIFRSVALGSLIAIGALGFLISPLTLYLGIAGSLFYYWAILCAVPICFVLLSFIVTGLTVFTHLREMP